MPAGNANRSAPAPQADEVLITHVFDAPRAMVFNAWTDPEHLQRWFAPRGCTLRLAKTDIRPGGAYLCCIRTPDGHDCWCMGVYREIVAPERLVFTMAVADANGHPAEPAQMGMDPEWPRETTVTVTFAEDGGRTRLTLHQTVAEALAKRTGAHPSWLDMLDRLDEVLAKVRTA